MATKTAEETVLQDRLNAFEYGMQVFCEQANVPEPIFTKAAELLFGDSDPQDPQALTKRACAWLNEQLEKQAAGKVVEPKLSGGGKAPKMPKPVEVPTEPGSTLWAQTSGAAKDMWRRPGLGKAVGYSALGGAGLGAAEGLAEYGLGDEQAKREGALKTMLTRAAMGGALGAGVGAGYKYRQAWKRPSNKTLASMEEAKVAPQTNAVKAEEAALKAHQDKLDARQRAVEAQGEISGLRHSVAQANA